MSISVDLLDQEIAALKQLTRLDNESEAVTKAAREFLRMNRLRELKSVSGKIEFADNWQELEGLELEELDFPR